MPQTRRTHCTGGCGRLRVAGPDFFVNKRDGGTRPVCKHCTTKASQSWNKKNPERHRAIYQRANHKVNIRRRFGLTVEQFDALAKQAGSNCAVCCLPETRARRLCLDHDHSTGELRGFICNRCNMLLGRVKDNPVILENAARYLRKPPLLGKKPK